MLVEDLTYMDCDGLLAHPWNLRNEEMVRDFSRERSNEWEGTLRRDPEVWTTELWVAVYNFLKKGRGWASRTDKFASNKFSTLVIPKDGNTIANCENPREKRVLEYIVLILYLEKPTRITMTMSNTISGALSSTRPVSWRVLIYEVVKKLVSRLEKGKPSPINSYLFHFYNSFEYLKEAETILLITAKVMLQFDIALEPEAQPEVKDADPVSRSDLRRFGSCRRCPLVQGGSQLTDR